LYQSRGLFMDSWYPAAIPAVVALSVIAVCFLTAYS
jgi:hypothetical protein